MRIREEEYEEEGEDEDEEGKKDPIINSKLEPQ